MSGVIKCPICGHTIPMYYKRADGGTSGPKKQFKKMRGHIFMVHTGSSLNRNLRDHDIETSEVFRQIKMEEERDSWI